MARTKKDARVSGGEVGWSHVQRWDPALVEKCADLARRGFSRAEAADYLGIPQPTMKYWWNSHPELREAVNAAREVPVPDKTGRRGGAGDSRSPLTLRTYIFGRLPRDLQEVWKRLEECDNTEDPVATVEAILADCGKTARQNLWLHAWLGSRFNKFDACRKVGVPLTTVQHWLKDDPDFAALAGQMLEIKKDYAESCLFLMAPDNAQAAIFLNRCLNRDRGYDPKVGVDVSGTVSHEVVDVADLDNLSIEDRRELLRLMRAAQGPKALPPRVAEGVVIEQSEGGTNEDQ